MNGDTNMYIYNIITSFEGPTMPVAIGGQLSKYVILVKNIYKITI